MPTDVPSTLPVDLPAATLTAQAIRLDVLIKEHGLSDRDAKALGHILEYGSLTIQDFEHLFPEVNRRSLQRDLRQMGRAAYWFSASTSPIIHRRSLASVGSQRPDRAGQQGATS